MTRALRLFLAAALAAGTVLVGVGPATPTGAATSELFISEYVEGGGLNKAIEIYNGTGAPVDLGAGGYSLELYSNGSASASQSVALSGTVADGDVFVVSHASASLGILAETDLQDSAVANFNGDDGVVLRKGGSIVDAFGQNGVDPGSEWPGGGQNDTLRRKSSVCAGDTDFTDAFDASVEWDSFAQDTIDGLGSHTADCGTGGPSELFISEYVEGGGFNKAIEIYNGTGAPVDLGAGAYALALYSNGSSGGTAGPSATLSLTGTIADGDVFVVANSSASADILAVADVTSGVANFNGDDGLVLSKDGVVVDAFGQYGVDPGSEWPGGGQNDTLRRKSSVCAGDTDFTDAFDASVEWDSFAQDTIDGLGSHTADCGTGGPTCDVTDTIADVQGTGASTPLDGDEVTVTGIVTADFGNEIVVQDGTGARSGVLVFSSGNDAARGDEVCVTGIASERFGQTQIGGNSNPSATVDTLSAGNPLPAAEVLPTGSVGAEDWEGVLVRVEDVTVSDDNPDDPSDFGEFEVDDTSGAVRVDDVGFGYPAAQDEELDFVQGPLLFTFGNFKIEPRDADDVGAIPDPTPIHEIQGSGLDVAITSPVLVEAIVVGDFQLDDQLDGFFVQEEDADADTDPATSEGIFVYCQSCPVDVAVGDLVRVTGTPNDFFDMSQVTATGAADVEIVSSGNTLPTASVIDLPAGGPVYDEDTYEHLEGMLVTFDDTLYVSEYFELARFGQLILTADARPAQFTDANEPSVAGYDAFIEELDSRRIILDDDDNTQNSPIEGATDEPYYWPRPGLSTTNTIRGGDSISGLTGVMHWSFAGWSSPNARPFQGNAWRLRPVDEVFDYTFTSENPAPTTAPAVGGSFTVASFNVLNYFTTLDSRGADSIAELDTQRSKIATAICGLGADVVGLIEIENNGDTAVTDLLDGTGGVNDVCGGYDFVSTGVIGTDEIAVAFIYRTATAAPVGPYAILDSSVDARFDDDRNRPALAQTFVELATNGEVTVVNNHLKSKGSPCDSDGDPDVGDGQGNCNLVRTAAAEAMVDWLAGGPTGWPDADVLIIGDLNSYRNEDPIDAIEAGGYIDLLDSFLGAGAYSYLFDGQIGYLDHALANSSLVGQVTGAGVWHINADEIPLFDYNDSIDDGSAEASFERESSALPIDTPGSPLRSSDHDPVLVGLDLTPSNFPPVCSAAVPSRDEIPVRAFRFYEVDIDGVTDPEGGPVDIVVDAISQDEPVARRWWSTQPDAYGVGSDSAKLRSERDWNGDGRVYHIDFTATDEVGRSCTGTVRVGVPTTGEAVDGGPLYDSTDGRGSSWLWDLLGRW